MTAHWSGFVVRIAEEYPVLRCFLARNLRLASLQVFTANGQYNTSKWIEMGQPAKFLVWDAYSTCCIFVVARWILPATRFGIPNSPAYWGYRKGDPGSLPNSFLVELRRSFESPGKMT